MKKADVGVAAYIVAAFVMLIVPIPSWLLDVLLACNIAIAFTILFTTMFSKEVLDMSFLPGGTLNVGTNHPHMLTLKVENLTANEHKPKPSSQNTFNIGSVSGTQVQIGERNHLIVNISITELVEKVSQSQDPQAKSLLKDLLNNSTVASLVGAGASALLALL